MDTSQPKDRITKQVPIWLVVTILVTLGIGLTAGIFITNSLARESVSMSTADVVSFVFTVGLGAGSLLLAVVTIVLSKYAEDTLIRRSDEGIRLQNEAFLRTNEVLMKIESSTGVTERRIEDIIAGRTGTIAQAVIDRSLSQDKAPLSQEELDKMKSELSESIRQEVLPLLTHRGGDMTARITALSRTQERTDRIRRKFKRYKTLLLQELSKSSNVQDVVKGEGQYNGTSAEEFWDVLFKSGEKRFGIVAFLGHHFNDEAGPLRHWTEGSHQRNLFAQSLSWRITQDNIEVPFLVSDVDIEELKPLNQILADVEKSAKSKVLTVSGSPSEVTAKILQKLK